jgi:STE24 endopeptidase
MSEMTATRKAALIVAGCVLWVVAAWFLWRTRVPDLRLPRLDVHALFPSRMLARADRHDRVLDRLWIAETAVQLAVLGLAAARAPRLATWLRGRRVLRAATAAVAVLAAAWLAALPLHGVGHWWQRRYGVTHQAYLPWLLQALRGLALTLVVAAVAAAVLSALAGRFGRRWWPAGAVAVVAVGAAAVMLAPFTAPGGAHALRDARLASEIRRLARIEHVSPPHVVVERASRRTTLANAEAIGLGPTERVVLWDTLLDGRYSGGEIRFVAAHELAHLARRHVWKGLGWLALIAVPAIWLLARIANPGKPAEVPRAVLFVVALQLVLLPLTNAISRRYEREADWLALTATHDPASARALFVRFAELALARPQPPEWSHVLLDDHPSFLERIELAREFRSRAGRSRAGPESP